MVLVQHYARTKRISIAPMVLALLVSLTLRSVQVGPHESLEHWAKGLAVYMTGALIVPRLFRRARSG